MIGIPVGRSTKTSTLSVYNPITKQYYEPETYKFDPSRLPRNKFLSCIHYDGGLVADHSHKMSQAVSPGHNHQAPPAMATIQQTTLLPLFSPSSSAILKATRYKTRIFSNITTAPPSPIPGWKWMSWSLSHQQHWLFFPPVSPYCQLPSRVAST